MRLNRTVELMLMLIALFGYGVSQAAPTMELENRLEETASVLRGMIQAPDGSIPADLLKRSSAVMIFPSVIKAGIGVGGHYGKGTILRRDPTTNRWGPPAFVTFFGGSFGWQVGVQSTQLVLLVMTEVDLKSIFRDKLTIGADASVAAGPIGRDASATTDLGLGAGILSYSRAQGLFAGVSIKGSVVEPDWEANEQYYGSDSSLIDIFFQGKGTASPAGKKLINLLNRYSS